MDFRFFNKRLECIGLSAERLVNRTVYVKDIRGSHFDTYMDFGDEFLDTMYEIIEEQRIYEYKETIKRTGLRNL